MTKGIIITTSFLSMWALMFLAVAFIQWEPDPAKWTDMTRFLFVWLSSLGSIVVVAFVARGKE
jgi:TRAP-type C4-dicarboxylate transport system permease small subunit